MPLGRPEMTPCVARQSIASATSVAESIGLRASSVAATPATCGVAMLVPDMLA